MNPDFVNPALQVSDACNKNCRACLRGTTAGNYKLSNDQVQTYLRDLRVLSTSKTISYQFVTGGEPTIWKDRGADIADILGALDDLGCIQTITMPTNGKSLETYEGARALVERISGAMSSKMVLGISIAEYQHNLKDDKCVALDNLMAVCAERWSRVIPIALVTLGVNDDTSERLSAAYPNTYQRVTALAPLGGGAQMQSDCPSLSLGGSDKSPLGSFLPHFKKDVTSKLKISNDEFEKMPNAEVVNRLSFFSNCGRSPFVTSKWHYCLPFRGDPSFDLCSLGEMQTDTIDRFIDDRPLLRSIRDKGVIATVQACKAQLSPEVAAKVDGFFDENASISVAYRGCMVCKALGDMGVWKELSGGPFTEPRPS